MPSSSRRPDPRSAKAAIRPGAAVAARPWRSISFSTPRFQGNRMKVLVINNDGGVFADYVHAPEGTTVSDRFQREVGSGKPDSYLIRVNRQPGPSDQALREGDRISFTSIKVEGAR